MNCHLCEKCHQRRDEVHDYDNAIFRRSINSETIDLIIVICLEIPGEEMLTWLPPSPPPSDAEDDIYHDPVGEYWFEQLPMSESRLPTTIHELHRPRPLASTTVTSSGRHFAPEVVMPTVNSEPVLPNPMPPIVTVPPSPTGMCTCDICFPSHESGLYVRYFKLLQQRRVDYQKPSFARKRSMFDEIAVASGVVRDVVSSPSASLSSISQERGINLVPQTGVSSGAAYLDTSNLLRPATPSHIPGSVEEAIDSVRKSAAQRAVITQVAHRPQGASGRVNLADVRSSKSELRRPFTPPPRQREAIDNDGTDWSIAEDHEMLSAITELQQLPDHLHSIKAGQFANWDLVSDLLSLRSTFYRSPRQCSLHYQMVVQPREEGRMVTLDPITKKTRRVPLSTGEMIHMKRGRTKTFQQYYADVLKLLSTHYDKRSKALRAAALKNTVPLRRKSSSADIEACRPLHSQELKFAEFGIRYDAIVTCSDVVEYRNERRLKLREQDLERLRLKEEEELKKEALFMEQQRSYEQKLIRKESAISAIPGIIHYQKVSYGNVVEHAQQQQLTSAVLPGMGTSTASTVRGYASGSYVQSPVLGGLSGQNPSYAADPTAQVIVGQRTYVDHQQAVASSSHQISTRRVAIPVGSGTSAQHQIVVTGSGQMGTSSGQQSYAVVVTSQESVANALSGQQLGGRFQHTLRQEGMDERPTVYRTLPPSATKRTFSATASAAQRIAAGYGVPPDTQQQIYATPSHSGRTLVMSGESSQPGEPSQVQMIRSQLQPGGISMRQDTRTRITQRSPGRLFVTTAAGDRTYLMQPQVRMIPGGQRITPKRPGTTLHAKTAVGQQVTMMLPSRGGTLPQIRTIPRNIGYQSSRVSSIGLVMGGSSRNSETIGGSGTTKQLQSTSGISRQPLSGTSQSTRQVTVAVQGGAAGSSSSSVLQGTKFVAYEERIEKQNLQIIKKKKQTADPEKSDHPIGLVAQQQQQQQQQVQPQPQLQSHQTQYLPPITLSGQTTIQHRYITSLPATGATTGGSSSSSVDGTTTTGEMPSSNTEAS